MSIEDYKLFKNKSMGKLGNHIGIETNKSSFNDRKSKCENTIDKPSTHWYKSKKYQKDSP